MRASVLAMAVDLEVVEADLAAGRLCCPVCDRPLARWGFAREREVRMLDGVRSLRPRRAYCHGCERTHVLLPAFSVPRRRDGAEVIGEALLAKAQGDGHRRIAARLGRPAGTVRGWPSGLDRAPATTFWPACASIRRRRRGPRAPSSRVTRGRAGIRRKPATSRDDYTRCAAVASASSTFLVSTETRRCRPTRRSCSTGAMFQRSSRLYS